MKIERLSLRNFRNILDTTMIPTEKVNFLVGSNGQGKTSFLEAISYLSVLRSFKDTKIAAMVQWGKQQSEISCRITSEAAIHQSQWKTDLRVNFQVDLLNNLKVTKIASINNKPYKSSTQYLTQRFHSYELGIHSIVFNPSDHDLVRGDPLIRRAYLDRVLSAEDPQYLKSLLKYHKILEQRNALLKKQDHLASAWWKSLTEQLCNEAARLVFERLNWIQRLNPVLKSILDKIAPNQPFTTLGYVSQWVPEIENLSLNNNKLQLDHFTGQGHLPSLKLLEQSFLAKVSALEAAEWKVGHTLVGSHRDDWIFFLANQSLKSRGSQGEVRSALLALKLSEIELFRNRTNHRPIFLLDDFSSELDKERRSFLMKFLMETDLQTFVTTTEDTYFIGKQYWISNGQIKEGSHGNRTETV